MGLSKWKTFDMNDIFRIRIEEVKPDLVGNLLN